MAPKLTRKSETGQINKSAIALGTSNNVNYAKDIIATIAMQGDVPLVLQSGDGSFIEAFYWFKLYRKHCFSFSFLHILC